MKYLLVIAFLLAACTNRQSPIFGSNSGLEDSAKSFVLNNLSFPAERSLIKIVELDGIDGCFLIQMGTASNYFFVGGKFKFQKDSFSNYQECFVSNTFFSSENVDEGYELYHFMKQKSSMKEYYERYDVMVFPDNTIQYNKITKTWDFAIR